MQNSTNICKGTHRATVKYKAHNGLTFVAHPKLHAGCKRHKRHHKRHGHHKRGHNKRGHKHKRSAVAHRAAVR